MENGIKKWQTSQFLVDASLELKGTPGLHATRAGWKQSDNGCWGQSHDGPVESSKSVQPGPGEGQLLVYKSYRGRNRETQ